MLAESVSPYAEIAIYRDLVGAIKDLPEQDEPGWTLVVDARCVHTERIRRLAGSELRLVGDGHGLVTRIYNWLAREIDGIEREFAECTCWQGTGVFTSRAAWLWHVAGRHVWCPGSCPTPSPR